MIRWNLFRKSRRSRRPVYQVESLESRILLTISFNFDYSLDTAGFFDDASRRTALEEAGGIVSENLEDTLAAIVAGSVTEGDSWTATYTNPATGMSASTVDLVVPENVIHVFVGARDLGGSLGVGGPGGFAVAFFTTEWRDIVTGRGQTGALIDGSETDFGPWGGTVTFDANANWHFGLDTTGLENGESDFLSVAIHELLHLVGIGTAPSWDNLVTGTSFTGPVATAEYDLSGNPPLEADGAHWLDDTTDNGFEAALDPTLLSGTRKLPTALDFAGLDDLGWDITPTLPVGPFVQLDLRIQTTPTATNTNGEAASLADSTDFLDEWDEFQVEIWASTPMDTATSVNTFAIELAFDELLFEATAIGYGAAFDVAQQEMIDSVSGIVTGISASTSESAIGHENFALLSTISFRVRADADLPADPVGSYILPTIDDEFLIQNITIQAPGGVVATTNAQAASSIEVWPVMYDLDDDGSVGFGDATILASVFGASTSTNGLAFMADYDHDGSISFGDVPLFAGAFGRSRLSLGTQSYFGEFPALWRPPEVQSGQAAAQLSLDTPMAEMMPVFEADYAAIIPPITERFVSQRQTLPAAETPEDLMSRPVRQTPLRPHTTSRLSPSRESRNSEVDEFALDPLPWHLLEMELRSSS